MATSSSGHTGGVPVVSVAGNVTRRASIAALVGASFLPFASRAQQTSSKVMVIVVPYPAGGPADVTARHMEVAIRRTLKQTIVVDNVSGASGAIGIEKVLAGPKDGNMLLFGTPSDIILAPLALSAVKHKPDQLRMIGLTTRTPLLLVSSTQFPAQPLSDLIASRRNANAKPLTYGSMGTGSMPHFAGEDFAARAKLQAIHVPYKGIAPLVQDLIGGQVDLGFLPVAGSTVDLVLQGKLRAYGVTANSRLSRLPAVPTITEAVGINDFNFEIWGGVFVAKSVPIDAAKRLNQAVNDALDDPEFRRQIEAAGAGVGHKLNLEEAEKFFVGQTDRYLTLARGIKLEPQ